MVSTMHYSQGCILEMGPRVGRVGRTYIPRTVGRGETPPVARTTHSSQAIPSSGWPPPTRRTLYADIWGFLSVWMDSWFMFKTSHLSLTQDQSPLIIIKGWEGSIIPLIWQWRRLITNHSTPIPASKADSSCKKGYNELRCGRFVS